MFYSQFILAKKGPLGTIWIAAHLERKLRKNQVADTDIGVSVDSILFPDVPIALRLSSHLLLGVVRIYSRKVNYLFDDCSETLLKVKQAFRSTAVDLPPEESTAPYHSITLPETFDLDDFELPDNAIFQGNYADHHISTKEQITLQDTMEGVVYSTSQFGLDERFGDGDTSHMCLDLDEDLFRNKHEIQEGVEKLSNTDADPQSSYQPRTPFEEDENNEMNEASHTMAAGVSENQDYAEAPTTPVLVEEPNLSNVQKALTCDDHLDIEDRNSKDLEAMEIVGTDSCRSDHHQAEHDMQNLNPKGDLLTAEENVEDLQNGCLSIDEASLKQQGIDDVVLNDSSLHGASKVENCLKPCYGVEKVLNNDEAFIPETSDIEVFKNVEQTCTPSSSLLNVEDQAPHISKDSATLDPNEEMASTRGFTLQPCNSNLDQTKMSSLEGDSLVASSDLPIAIEGTCSLKTSEIEEEAIQASRLSTEIEGEECHTTVAVTPLADSNVMLEPNLSEAIEADRSCLNESSKENLEFPAPEKLLSMPEGPNNLISDLLVESTPDKLALENEGDDTRSKVITGKKRSFTESTLTFQSLNSDGSFAKSQSKRTNDFIPDDDDLLSSILVGRRSSILKVKPTPTPSQVVPMKRPRLATRPSAYKRKVLMDDSMVLHGDAIRQQLTSTEDIRRVRKKAPSTRHEIWIIQKQITEEDIFNEPIFTGISMELIDLHNQAYDFSSIRISPDEKIASLTLENNIESITRPNIIKENETQGSIETSIIPNEETHAVILDQVENQQNQDFVDAQLQTNSILAETEVIISNQEHEEINEMEIDRLSVKEAVAPEFQSSCPTTLDLSNGNQSNPENIEGIQNDTILGLETEVTEILGITENNCKDPSIITSFPDTVECEDLIVASNDKSGEGFAKYEKESIKEHEIVVTEVGYDDMNQTSNQVSCEEPKVDSSCLVDDTKFDGAEIASAKDVENPSFIEEAEPHGTMDLENIDLDHHHVVGELGGMENNIVEHDTEFLNVDDDDIADDNEDYIPSAEETRFLENSGWSSRSRAVAKYLQTIFDKEAELGKKVIKMENLLSGKTRKEASRMFFETLVLKTRDYIHVEQQDPFNNINIKPRGKLMKSDF